MKFEDIARSKKKYHINKSTKNNKITISMFIKDWYIIFIKNRMNINISVWKEQRIRRKSMKIEVENLITI